jgi:hypothetical protein
MAANPCFSNRIQFNPWILIAMIALAPVTIPAQPAPGPVLAAHSTDLVVLRGDKLVPFKAGRFLQAPYTILYFGAGWCSDCRKFSPRLVAAYNRQPARAKKFEVLLLSRDKNAQGMLDFMRSEKMKWPALAFEKVATAADLKRFFSGHGIPCLTIIDPSGTIVLQSMDDQDAAEVLQQLENLVKIKKADISRSDRKA